MGAFRQELVLGRAEQAAAAEAFKDELRVLTGKLQAKFLEVEAAQQKLRHQDTEALKVELRTLVAQLEARFLTVEATLGDLAARPPAPATAAGQDPWWRRSTEASQAPWSGGAGAANQPATRRANFDLATEDTASDEPTQAGAGPPGFSAPQGWQPNWDSTRQSGRPESHSSEFKVDIRNWKSAPLDLDVKPEGFLAWRDRALVLLSGNRLDVRRLLQWAEKSSEPLDAAAERRGAQASGLVDDVATVSFALHGGLSFIVSDALLTHYRNCGDSGLEFWRQLAARWHGNSQQVLAMKSRRSTTQLAAPPWRSSGRNCHLGSRPAASSP